ncbi:MAG: hypothetical protein U0893_04160 [Chloroflexota bacterium]
MAKLPSQLKILMSVGETHTRQYDLLRRARCLSPLALANRAAVITLLDEATRAITTAIVTRASSAPSPSSVPELAPLGGPTVTEKLLDALSAAGYLDPNGCARFALSAGGPDEAQQFIERLGAPDDGSPIEPVRDDLMLFAGGMRSPFYPETAGSPSPGATVGCGRCGRSLPWPAVYCGYCGGRLW